MSLVPSLLQAIVRVDGEALVMHVGEKPYVVSPNGQIDLATRGLTFEAVNGLVAQLLPPDAMKSLEEVGATQFELPPFDEFPGEHFTVTAARGGDDVWAEIRRRPAHDDDLTAVDLFAGFTSTAPAAPPPPADDLALPQERQLWPSRPGEAGLMDAPAANAAAAAPLDEPRTSPAAVTPPAPAALVEELPAAHADAPVADAPVVVDLPETLEAPAAALPVVADMPVVAVPIADVAPVDLSPVVADAPVVVAPVVDDVPVDVAPGVEDAPAVIAPGVEAAPVDVAPGVEETPVVSAPGVEDVSSALAPAVEEAPVVEPAVVQAPLAAVPAVTVEPPVTPAPAVSQAAIATWLAEFATAAVLHKPDAHAASGSPVTLAASAPFDTPVDTPAEPAVSVSEPEPERAPEFVTLSAPPSVEVRAADRESEADMSIPPQGIQPFAPAAPAPVAAASGSFAANPLIAPDSPRVAAFAPFPSLADQAPQVAAVLPSRSTHDVVAGGPAAAGLERLVRLAASRGATALYLSSGVHPSVRLDGDVQTLEGTTPQTAADIDALLLGAAPDAAMQARAGGSAEWVWQLDDVGSVRCTSFRDHRGPGAVFRIVAVRPQAAAQLGLSREVQALAAESEGLVLVSGPRANGKSTLISSLVDLINRTRRDYVITIESEVNVVHERHGAFVSQREVRGGSDEALAAARAALREDPDVLVIDDLRTAGLMSVALDAAANGQLVIGGVPAHHASGAIERLIDVYQPEQRRQVQLAIAQNLRGVVSQVLLRKSGGGRVAAREILLNTPIVASLLAEGRLNQLPLAIEGGRKSGMVPMNDALVGFVQSGAVDVRDAYRRAVDRAGLLDLLKRQGIDTSVVERLA